MKTLKLLPLCISILICSCTTENQNQNYASPNSELEKFSYSIGVNIATSLKQKQDLKEIDGLSVAKGFNDVIYNNELDISLLSTDSILNEYFFKIAEEKRYIEAADELKKGEEFLEENAKRKEIKTTVSGLQYEILKLGTQEIKAQNDNVVTIHYQASLISGEVYDSSIDKEPVTFPLNSQRGTINGLNEGIQLMSVGDQYKFYIPAKLAYGNSSPEGSPIPPGSTLIFVVELVNISTIEGTQL